MSDDAGLDLRSAAREVIAFRDERDWQRFHAPKNLAAALAIEAGELQEIFLWKPPQPASELLADPHVMEQVEAEVADCAIYVLLLAHELRIDLDSAIKRKLTSNRQRYPVDEHRGVARKADKSL